MLLNEKGLRRAMVAAWRDAEDDAVVYMAVKRSSEDWWQILETAVLPRA